ncbi:MAG TPA: FAD:protein FMN transferase [Solirubrobacteraceae bacterium]|nr:FAD:protein FMN transferase [Solirubrobacteraceae bacterium]
MTAAAVAPGPAQALVTERWEALGTTVVLRYIGPPDASARVAVELELQAIDAAASRFRPDSELSRLNAASGRRVEVSPLLAEAVRLALRAAQITGGAVDPTLGQSLISVGYDRDFSELERPDELPGAGGLPGLGEPYGTVGGLRADRPSARRRTIVVRRRTVPAWRRIELFEHPPAIRLAPGTMLDLGATAKALAADRAAHAALRALGARDRRSSGAARRLQRGVLVSIGGDVATAGPPPAGGWAVHVTDDHRAGPEAPGQTVSISSGGLATSSIVTRRWSHHGRTMHHILDPAHGAPASTCWRTVSVAAASCADANIASTAAIVMGAAGSRWLAEQGLPCRLVAIDGAVRVQGGWPR